MKDFREEPGTDSGRWTVPDCHCNVQCYMLQFSMVASFRHRGLKRLFELGDVSKVHADKLSRISDVLFHLDQAQDPGDLDLQGYRLHPLKGDRKGYWSVTISRNWRITFRFEDGDVYEVDLVDYH